MSTPGHVNEESNIAAAPEADGVQPSAASAMPAAGNEVTFAHDETGTLHSGAKTTNSSDEQTDDDGPSDQDEVIIDVPIRQAIATAGMNQTQERIALNGCVEVGLVLQTDRRPPAGRYCRDYGKGFAGEFDKLQETTMGSCA